MSTRLLLLLPFLPLCLLLFTLAACSSAERRTSLPPPSAAQERPIDGLARLIHEEVNAYRADQGLPRLTWNAELAEIARRHSLDMAERDYFSHESPEGTSPTGRAQRSDYECRKQRGNRIRTGIGENIYATSQYESYRVTRRGEERTISFDWKSLSDVADEVVNGWIRSPGHRQNLVNDWYSMEGIGVVRRDDYRIYVTQNLC